MKIELIYHTLAYHKLVETIARVCYQSFAKENGSSHKSVRAIMAKGHLSIASVGNLVFTINYEDAASEVRERDCVHNFLMDAHEVTQFIKWSRRSEKQPSANNVTISMNMLTYLDLRRAALETDEFSGATKAMFLRLEAEMDKVPYLKWFYDKSVEIEDSPNPYSHLGVPELYAPIVLDEDYTKLKLRGLTAYELEIHAQITMNFMTDRAASLQFWRHWSGGCELSQRYVSRKGASFREMVGLDVFLQEHVEQAEAEQLASILSQHQIDTISSYDVVYELCQKLGLRAGRAKEIARSILPNNIVTQCMQSRPYRNWLHLFELRDSVHAQAEIREDVLAMKKQLALLGVPTEK